MGTGSTLVLGPSMGSRRCDAVSADGARRHLLVVSLVMPPGRWMTDNGFDPADVASLAFVTTEDVARGRDATGNVPVATVSSPSDLTGLGIRVSSFVSRCPDPGAAALCFDSLTVLLQYADQQTAYRFLNTVVGRLGDSGVAVTVHLAPEAVGEQVVSTFWPLFDDVVHADGSAVRPPG